MDPKLLLSVAQGITQMLGPLAVNEIGLLWGVKGAIRKLRDTVSTIEDVLLDAEEKHAAGDRAVTNWLGRLQDAFFDADDLLDAISTDDLRSQIMTPEKKVRQVRIFFSKSNQLVYHILKAHKIKAIRQRLDAIVADGRILQLAVRPVKEPVGENSERGNTHWYVCAEHVFGREDDKKAVINRLLDSNAAENVLIHAIVGIGGLGKTTLAQLIYNAKEIVENNFEPKLWVCVSNSFKVEDVVGKILEAATNTKPEAGQMGTLVGKLKEKIDGKKYFLVLDDVWNDNLQKWSGLKALLMGGARGSRILVTTRTKTVAEVCGADESYILRGLNDHASWSLLKQVAFKKGQEPMENSRIATIGKEILAKCSGVPLAIRTIGSLLFFNNSEEEWMSFKKNELSKISQNEEDIIPTLKLSYDHLPSHLKPCFAYCRLFPKNYNIQRSKLIQLWIAQGFVELSDQNQCLEDVGNKYFMELLGRSFLQEDQVRLSLGGMQYKMHDLMHDLASSVAGSMMTSLHASVDEKTRHVSVDSLDLNFLSITTSLCKASSKRTLLFPKVSYMFARVADWEKIISCSKFLRVLELRNFNLVFLPSSIGKLKHLRYLDLSNNDTLKRLPDSITELQNLQTLKLVHCYALIELPRDIGKLVNLRHLEIDACTRLTYMPRGFGQLTNLQTLQYFLVNKDPLSGGLRELNGLNSLRGEFCIENLELVKDVASEGKAANLKEKNHLKLLLLNWRRKDGGGLNDSDANFVDHEVLLKNLEPHPNLEVLAVSGNCGSRLPSWLLSLTNLKTLELGDLDALEYILDNSEFSSSSSLASDTMFPSLEGIHLYSCPILKGWWRRRDSSVEVNSDTNNFVEITVHPLLPSFPCLSKLEIKNCPMLTSMPMFPLLKEELALVNVSWKLVQQIMMMNMEVRERPTSIATTSSLSTPLSQLKSMRLVYIADLETLPEEVLKNLTSLESLTIKSCNRLNSLSPGIQHLTALQNLDLDNCPKLELADDEDGMQWQGLKSLLSLEFTHLPKLVSLPLGLQHATTLQSLNISNCENLMAIPEWIQNCTSLQRLKIVECSSLTSLPEGMRSLTTLQRLTIEDCPILLQRCERETGKDWHKIVHIPELDL